MDDTRLTLTMVFSIALFLRQRHKYRWDVNGAQSYAVHNDISPVGLRITGNGLPQTTQTKTHSCHNLIILLGRKNTR